MIGIENQTIVIKHGSIYARVHPCRVMHENSEFKAKQIKDQQDNSQKRAVKEICNDLTICESLDSDSEEDSQHKDSFDEMDELIHMDNHITTTGEHNKNASEIIDQEAIENSEMNKSDPNAETAEEEEAEENMSAMNNQDNTENSQNANTRQHVFSPVLLPRLKSTVI